MATRGNVLPLTRKAFAALSPEGKTAVLRVLRAAEGDLDFDPVDDEQASTLSIAQNMLNMIRMTAVDATETKLVPSGAR